MPTKTETIDVYTLAMICIQFGNPLIDSYNAGSGLWHTIAALPGVREAMKRVEDAKG